MKSYNNEYGTIYLGDNREVLSIFEDDSIEAMITDPPYGYRMHGASWDYDIPTIDFWKQTLRVLKPGAHILVASGTRVQHRMACNIEDAGFVIRDVIAWVYAEGVSKGADLGKSTDGKWKGWKITVKPAMEFWTLARKPLGENTIAKNLKKYQTGALHIDACRVDNEFLKPWKKNRKPISYSVAYGEFRSGTVPFTSRSHPEGREPYNFIHDGSDEVTRLFTNGAQHFFYCPKASQKERREGLEGKNIHPTVKPVELMQYLVR
ncbi:MAG: DNA methyltransferase, partial [Candidatus Cloacimonas acidaminovorans]|nr:DNA methyltransferase [Candidatus Cloacimonas acidaminovorans]